MNWDCLQKMYLMGVHKHLMYLPLSLFIKKVKKKWENEKTIQNSDHGERQDNLMGSCFLMFERECKNFKVPIPVRFVAPLFFKFLRGGLESHSTYTSEIITPPPSCFFMFERGGKNLTV